MHFNEGYLTKRKLSRHKLIGLKMSCLLYILLLFGLASGATSVVEQAKEDTENESTQTYETEVKDTRGLRMDYDQWKPLGRGDPLKNDPTYDYMPPVLERVHYWVDSPVRKQDSVPENKKSEILVLGVSSKKPSTQPSSVENRRDSYEPFLKFIDGPKFHQNNHNSFNRPNNGHRPSSSFHSQFYKNKFDDVPHHKLDEQRVPYTVLVPPPIPPPHVELPLFNLNTATQPPPTTTQSPVYTPVTTTASPPTVSVQEANLIYHSSSTGKRPEWQGSRNPYATNSRFTSTENSSSHFQLQESETNINRVVFREPSLEKSKPQLNNKSNHKSSIVFPTESGKIIFEQHSTVTNPINSVANTPSQTLLTPGPIIQPISSSPTVGPPLQYFHTTGVQQVDTTQMSVGMHMHKGQVSDDTIGNTYVNIGKPNAHIQQEITVDTPLLGPVAVEQTTEYSFVAHSSVASAGNKPYISTAYPYQVDSTYINRPIANVPISAINNIVSINSAQPFRRRPYPMRDYAMYTMQKMRPPPPPTTEMYQAVRNKPSGFLHSILQNEVSTTQQESSIPISTTTLTTTPPTPTTTMVTSLTTDPLFKHYKQPAEPLKGPMYLIIQGHSKVKTYGPANKQVFKDLTMTENNEIPKADKYPVKHLHSLKDMLEANEEYDQISKSRSKNARTLKDLVDDGIGKYDFRETELGAGFEVSDGKTEVSSEKYHKGIVETDDMDLAELRKLKKMAKIREKRQLEEFLPVVEDKVEELVYDYLKQQSEGSGVGAVIASAITHDSLEDDVYNEISQDDDPIDDVGDEVEDILTDAL